MDYDAYSGARDLAHRMINSSLRDRPRGFEGVLSDLKVVEELMGERPPASVDPAEWRAGLQSVWRECHTYVRSYGR